MVVVDLSFVKLSLHIMLNVFFSFTLLTETSTLIFFPNMAAVIVPTPQRTLPSGPVPPEQFAHVVNLPPQTVILPDDHNLVAQTPTVVTPRDEIPTSMPSVLMPVLIEPVPAPVSSDCGKLHLVATCAARSLSFEVLIQ